LTVGVKECRSAKVIPETITDLHEIEPSRFCRCAGAFVVNGVNEVDQSVNGSAKS
jgi:hypothetical protein